MIPFLARRLPKWEAILPVFAVTAFLIYGRSIYVFVFKLSSWLTFLTVGEILSTLAYGLVLNLLESLFLLLCFLAVAFILPGRWLRDVFVPSGTWFFLVGILSVLLYFRQYASIGPDYLSALPLWLLISLGLAVIMAFLGGRIRILSSAAAWLADRLMVFLYIFVPASLVSMVIVLIRNLI